MFHGSSVYRLVAFATSLALSALVILPTTGLSFGSARLAAAPLVTIA